MRIRLPHALVMTALFRSGSLHKLLSGILGLTWEHAKRLGLFVAVYKGVLSLMRLARGHIGPTPTGQPAAPLDPAVAGGLAAYLVWYGGAYHGVSYQIALYLLGRVLVAAARYAAAQGIPPFSYATFKGSGYPALVVGTWAAVMWLYETEGARGHLQHSLTASMRTLYTDSNAVAMAADGTTSSTLAHGSSLDVASLAPTAALAAVLVWAGQRALGGGDAVLSLLQALGLQDVCIGSAQPGRAAAPGTPRAVQGTPAARPTATPVRGPAVTPAAAGAPSSATSGVDPAAVLSSGLPRR